MHLLLQPKKKFMERSVLTWSLAFRGDIIADKNSNLGWIASDLIAQAEHDIFAQSILITNSKDLIKK